MIQSSLPFEPGEPVTPSMLFAAAQLVKSACSLQELAFEEHAHISIYDHPAKEHRDLINSFFYEDIVSAIKANATNSLPLLVEQMFKPLPAGGHVDVLRSPGYLRKLFSQGKRAVASWPDKHMQPVLMQEAVIEATHLLTPATPILAVNGPPGTGKTTLLRSFIADRVFEQAKHIADVCEDLRKMSGPDGGYYELPACITGCEIIVASSNNGAIENISRELPGLDSVRGFDDSLMRDRGYYQSVAQFIADFRNTKKDRRVWGLIAASLGNKDKRNAFIGPFLFEDPKRTNHPDLDNMRTFQRRGRDISFTGARNDFLVALRRVTLLQEMNPDDDGFWDALTTEQHTSAPYNSDDLVEAKRNVFVQALRLHRAYIDENWPAIHQNLRRWAKAARNPQDFSEHEARAVWQTLFLVVPVVSTTFASARRMLGNANELGWAVIDEAGQAVPQAALSLFSRTRRAIVVGDPLQLEPVVTLSGAIIKGFRDALDVDPRWTAANDTGSSLQTIVERTSPWGTSRKVGDAYHWFGIPLVVHRRCDEPMFSIVNDTVYSGDMICRTNVDYDQLLYPYGESCWIDERSTRTSRHAVMSQIDLVLDAIFSMSLWYQQRKVQIHRKFVHLPDELDRVLKQWQRPDIKVVTPFRDIERHFHERCRERAPERKRGAWRKWCDENVGTVHKAQGKEAGVIFCILGLDATVDGAAEFATSKPNFMNVAVSRAKHRLYVVGAAPLWGSKDYFREVYSALDGRDAVVDSETFSQRFRRLSEVSLVSLLPQ